MMHRRYVVELRGAVGVGDRDVGRRARVHVGGKDPPPGEAVNRGDERRPDVGGEGEGQPVEVVVDEVEVAGARQRVGHVERLPDAPVHRGVFGVALGADPVEGRRGLRIERREQRHVDAPRDQSLREEARDLFPGAVVSRRRTPGHRAQEADLHGEPFYRHR